MWEDEYAIDCQHMYDSLLEQGYSEEYLNNLDCDEIHDLYYDTD